MKNRYLILAVLSALLYLPSVFGGFMWDDEDIITGDPIIHQVSNAGKVFTPGYWKRDFPGAENRYRPLRSLLLMGEWKLWGKNPGGYHAVRVAVNAAAVCLAFWLSFLLLKDPDKAFVSALVFALHPAHVESVAWLKNVTDMLVFIFTALSAGLLVRDPGKERRGFLLFAPLLFFALALASKENAVMLPALALSWLCLVEEVKFLPALKRVAPEAVLGAVFLAFAVLFLRRGPALPAFEFKTSALAFAQYLRLLFLPFDLNADRWLVTLFDAPGPLLAAGVFAYSRWKGEKAGAYAVVWMVLCLVPFLDNRFMTGRPIAEQRLYTAALGLGFAAGAFYKPDVYRRGALAALALLFAGFTAARNFDWISPVKLWEKTAASSPDSPRAWNNLGVSYERAGRFSDAAAEYGKAAALEPSVPGPFLNMADLYYKAGKPAEAKKIYSEIYAREPGSRRAALGLLRLELEAGGPGADKILEGLLAAHGGDPEVLNSAGVAHMFKGRYDAALDAFGRAIKANPENADAYYNLAALYQRTGRPGQAAETYRALLGIAPAHPDALNNLAILTDMAGDEAGAIKLFRRAEEAAPGFYQAAYNLGGIYYRKKLYLEALSEYSRVLKYKPDHAQAAKKAEELRKLINEDPGK